MWQAYCLIRTGDQVAAMTQQIVKLKLRIAVEDVEFNAEADELRLKGRNLTDSEHVRHGAYHTLSIGVNNEFTLNKESWDSVDLDRVFQSTNVAASADLAVLLITDGFGQLFLIGSHATVPRGTAETNLPRKQGPAAAGYAKSWESFMNKVYQVVEKNVNFEVVRCFVIAGPGFAKETFRQYLNEECVRREHRHLAEYRDRIITVHASTAYKHGIKEVLADASIADRIQNTKALDEIKALDDFHRMLARDSARAFYGPGHVLTAADMGAVEALLISDELLRSSSIQRRKRYVQLVESVREAGGAVYVFSMAHVSGEQLHQLSGIAAILRYPLPDIEDQEIDEEALFR